MEFEDLEKVDNDNTSNNEDDFDKRLIMEIKSYPLLYTGKGNTDECENAWINIAETLDEHVDNCKLRWRRLKQYFSKKRHELDKNGSSYSNSFKLYDDMLFMDAYIARKVRARKRKFTKVVNSDVSITEQSNITKDSNDSTIVIYYPEEEISPNQCVSMESNSNKKSKISSTPDDYNVEERVVTEENLPYDNRIDFHSDDEIILSDSENNFTSCTSTKKKSIVINIPAEESIKQVNTDSSVFSLNQNESQSIESKTDSLRSKYINDENSIIVKLLINKLKKIDPSAKNEFKLACMKILYSDFDDT